MNKPLHLSRKAQIALITLFFNVTAAAVCEALERRDLQPLALQCITALGAILIAGFAAQDHGKEAAMAGVIAGREIEKMVEIALEDYTYPDEGEDL